jgi:very-short-patch-repair endonuclease
MASPDSSGLAVLFTAKHPLPNPLPSRERGSIPAGAGRPATEERIVLSPLVRESERGGSSMHRVKEDMSKQPQTALARRLRHEQTDAERAIWEILRRKQMSGFKFRRQQPIGPYIVDFVSLEKRLIIEIDGGQHAEVHALARDEARSMWLRGQGYQVLRFWNNEVLVDREAVAESIRVALEREDAPSP